MGTAGDVEPQVAPPNADGQGANDTDKQSKSRANRVWAVVVGAGVLVGLVAGVAQMWDVWGPKPDAPAVRSGPATSSAPAASPLKPSCWRSEPRTTGRTNFAVCLSSNIERNGRDEVQAFPGAWVWLSIEFVNTGSTQLDDVLVRTQLPKGLTLDPSSLVFTTSKTPSGDHLTTNYGTALGAQGIVIGSYAANSNGYVGFYAKVDKDSVFDCGNNRRVVTAHADTTAGSKGTDMVVTIVRQC